jgi:glutathione peroxidase
MERSIHNIKINKLDGTPLDWSKFEGKSILIVNVASECGCTPQYGQLQELYNEHADNLEIVGVPCNDFGGQEPGTAIDIEVFCTKNYGVTFTLSEKIGILNNTHPLYEWLTNKSENNVLDTKVEWNFHKFLVNPKGHLVKDFASNVSPISEEILSCLQT